MKIAILGTRGIPARYGGFETFAEQIAIKLTQKGHAITVYCRRAFTREDDAVDSRIRRVVLPSLPSKYFDTLFHTFLSILHVLGSDADVVLICNVANSGFAWIPRLALKPTILNVDGLDRRRKKWNWLGQGILHLCEILATVTPTALVTDAKVVQDYFSRRYKKSSRMIAYGAEVPVFSEQWAVDPMLSGKYILFVSRLEPEYNAELVIRAFGKIDTDWRLVIVGGNAYRPSYVDFLKSLANDRVLFPGPVYEDYYWTLRKHAGVFVYAGEVGGTHPAILEALVAGNPLLCIDTPENREVASDAAQFFTRDENDLSSKIARLIQDQGMRDAMSQKSFERGRCYGWEAIVTKYEDLCTELLGASAGTAETR